MKVKASTLISDLIVRTEEIIEEVKTWQTLPQETLLTAPEEGAWNAIECLEHLNRYGDFYHPEIERRMDHATPHNLDYNFRSSWLGEYFAKAMLPKEKLNKMNTFKRMNPRGSGVGLEQLEEFLSQQNTLLLLLSHAKNVNLNKVKTNISISKWIQLRLGDTFRVVVYHNQRHIVQARRAIDLTS